MGASKDEPTGRDFAGPTPALLKQLVSGLYHPAHVKYQYRAVRGR